MQRGTFVVRRLTVAGVVLAAGLMSFGCSDDNTGTNPSPAGMELNSGTLVQGQQYVHVFATAGTYPYHCAVHPGMRDTIDVNAASPNDSAAIGITSSEYLPARASVRPGGMIRWINGDVMSHTVTSD